VMRIARSRTSAGRVTVTLRLELDMQPIVLTARTWSKTARERDAARYASPS
jgi:hypothetical protein